MAEAALVGAVLAGGRGERLGGAKALAELRGRPLIAHALDALRAVTPDVVVVAKRDTPLPPLDDVPVWHDDERADFHPRHGIVTALRRAAGAPVLVLAVDLPFADLRPLAAATGTAVARDETGLQPLCARYAPETLPAFEQAPPDEPLTRTVERLQPQLVDLPPGALRNINTPDDLRKA